MSHPLRPLPVLTALGLLLAAPHARAQPPFDELGVEVLVDGLPGSPVAITHAGDQRLFFTLKEGQIVVWDGDRLLPQPFLDLRGQVSQGAEQGLLSAAFHPDFAANGLFFVDYTDLAGNTVVARYRVSADPDRADPASRAVLLEIAQPFPNHNGGQLQFGPDGTLYIGMGDGGSGNDPMCNAQRADSLLGKLLRLDVDANLGQPPFFGIPVDNPFRGPGGFPDEVWALGLRNPWRFSFDRLTGDLWIADVGQNAREEVDFQPAGSAGGANYGWKVMEGTLCLSDQGCPQPVPGCNAAEYTDPILEYDHSQGDCSISGGYVYRGSEIAGLDGVYLYGDFCSGAIRAAQRFGSVWSSRDLGFEVPQVVSFGEDVDGELYLASLGGTVFRLTGPGQPPPQPGRLELTEGDRSALETAGGVVFAVRRVDGDDGAVSVRYSAGGGTAVAGEDYLPTMGTLVWADREAGIKTFDLPLLDDGFEESPETVEITLGNPTGGAQLGARRATLTILDDDLVADFDSLRLEPLTGDLPGSPVAITHAGDGRLFLTLKEGAIVIWDGERVLPEPFLDLRGQVGLQFEQGLLSTAFHPGYAGNGLFFVDFTNTDGDTVIARFRVSGDPDRADPASRRDLLIIDQPGPIHNGGQLQFGPDGFLYIGLGDGGGMFDPACSAQRTDTVLGKMLRIDVDASPNQPPFYGIPPGNPFAGPGDPADEVWALGFRNPWRFSFDRLTGDLYIADVGQGLREEVSFQPAGSPGGENYGWKVMEGTFCQSAVNCPPGVPPCHDPAYTDPILEVEQGPAGDCAVIGGYVYRGAEIPALDGVYLYGDFCSGIVRAAMRTGATWQSQDLALRVPTLTTFGEDVDGELVLASLSGNLYRLTATAAPPTGPCIPGSTTLCLAEDRFRVEVEWQDFQGGSGSGMVHTLTEDTGAFWFFDPANLELVVKVIDACGAPFDRFWVFAGGLTNVGVDLTVTDTQALDAGAGEAVAVRRYTNALGVPFAPVQDTAAFATCP